MANISSMFKTTDCTDENHALIKSLIFVVFIKFSLVFRACNYGRTFESAVQKKKGQQKIIVWDERN